MAQCPTGLIYLQTQEQIDEFVASYPDCEHITGDLFIQGVSTTSTDIVDISGLSNITTIDGSLRITFTKLTQLNGLNNLQHVGGSLFISWNDDLNFVDGLNNLTSVNDELYIFGNPNLTSLAGLSNLTSAGSLGIQQNDILPNLDGLENLNTLNGALQIAINNNLSDISGIRNIDPTTIKNFPLWGTGLTIALNPLLNICHYPNICEAISLVGTSPDFTFIEIFSNDGDCIDQSTLELSCAAPLSATDIYIDARIQGATLQVEWSMPSAGDKVIYIVQRSADGISWKNIGSTSSHINTINYSYHDFTPLKGYNYYRIKVRNEQGQEMFSKVKHINMATNSVANIFPNPVQDMVTIQTNHTQQITIKNTLGQVMYQGSSNTSINVANWKAGMYTIQLETGESMKLIIE